MPADTQTSINLLDTQDLSRSPIGRIIAWITSYGRYIMVMTELVVLIAFASRFTLDRNLTDLKEEIAQKQEILAANQELETTIRDTQNKLTQIKSLLVSQNQIPQAVKSLQQSMAPGVYLENLNISKDHITSNVASLTSDGFSQFLVNAKSLSNLSNVEITNVSKQPMTPIKFSLSASVEQQK